LTDPASYLGSASAFIDRVLAAARPVLEKNQTREKA